MSLKLWYGCTIAVIVLISAGSCSKKGDEEDFDPYTTTDPKLREPSPCEVCKIFVTELQSRLEKSGKSKEMIETGHGLEKKKKFKYSTSELRLDEALLEPHICENIMKYNVHAEREGSLRYAKGQSETMSTLHGLVNKGVQVELGIPLEMWDNPSAEISKMHRACFHLAEHHEEDIEDWYYNFQDQNLMHYLCGDKYLPRFPEGSFNKDCLKEVFTGKKGEEEETEKAGKPVKKKKKKKAPKKEMTEEDTPTEAPQPDRTEL